MALNHESPGSVLHLGNQAVNAALITSPVTMAGILPMGYAEHYRDMGGVAADAMESADYYILRV